MFRCGTALTRVGAARERRRANQMAYTLLYRCSSQLDKPLPEVERGDAMSAATDKSAVLDQIERERERWERLLAGVDQERMLQLGATGDWTFRDVVSHLNGWRRRTLDRLEAARDSREPAPPPWPAGLDEYHEADIDLINAWLEQTGRATSPREVIDEYSRSFERLRATVEAIPEPHLFDPGRYPWMRGEPVAAALTHSYEHLHEHEELLAPWLSQADAGGGA